MKVARYLEIKNLCNMDTYSFLHEMKVSPESYNVTQFFEYILDKREIEYIEYKFSSNNIAGHYYRDALGKSIMINTSNDRQTRKGTGLHELGHDTLHINLEVTQEFQDEVDSLYSDTEDIEIEANTASMMYYLPDISLYSAVSDPAMNYRELLKCFDIPDWLLDRRMIRFLQINCMMTFDEAEATVIAYQGKSYYEKNSFLQEIVKIETFEKKIVTEFTDPSFLASEKNVSSRLETRSLFIV